MESWNLNKLRNVKVDLKFCKLVYLSHSSVSNMLSSQERIFLYKASHTLTVFNNKDITEKDISERRH